MDLICKLKAAEISPKDQKRLGPVLSNWLTTYDYIRELPASVKGMEELVKLMILEIGREEGARKQIIVRLYSRYKSIRLKVEYDQVMAYAGAN